MPQRHHFVPLTEATIQHEERSGDYRVGVAIVNLRMAASLRKVAPGEAEVGDGSDTESNPPR